MLAKTCSHRWLFSENTFALCCLLAEKQGASSETGKMIKPATARWLLEPTYQEMGSLFTHINKQHWLWKLSKGKWSCWGRGGGDLTVYGYKTCEKLGDMRWYERIYQYGRWPPQKREKSCGLLWKLLCGYKQSSHCCRQSFSELAKDVCRK